VSLPYVSQVELFVSIAVVYFYSLYSSHIFLLLAVEIDHSYWYAGNVYTKLTVRS
jgi:hypothetical protein